jgi:hypothetical protein
MMMTIRTPLRLLSNTTDTDDKNAMRSPVTRQHRKLFIKRHLHHIGTAGFEPATP